MSAGAHAIVVRPVPRFGFVAVNLVGGAAVLVSYAVGLATHPETRDAIWGGVPEALRPLYTVSMLAAALGWFAFTLPLLLGVDPRSVRVAGRFGFGAITALYAAILAPSALWMPLTFAMLDAPSAGLWWAIRAVLACTGLASLALFAALARLEPRPARGRRLAMLAGCAAFCFQTALLDALVWPAFFPR